MCEGWWWDRSDGGDIQNWIMVDVCLGMEAVSMCTTDECKPIMCRRTGSTGPAAVTLCGCT